MPLKPIHLIMPLSLVFMTAAYAAPPIHVNIAQPQTPLSKVFSDLSQQTGTPIITDGPLSEPMDVANLQASSMGAMLADLKGLDPKLSWHKIYIAASSPLPTGAALEQQVSILKTAEKSGLIVLDSGDSLWVVKHKAVSLSSNPAGMKTIYLVTDKPQISQQAPASTGDPVTQATSGLTQVANVFGAMTAQQQMQALPQMYQQFRTIMQEMAPSVRAQIQQQWGGGNRQGMVGGP